MAGEVADLLLGERDVLDVAPAEPGQAALDLRRRQPVAYVWGDMT
jgi:hypothetical protein